MKKRKLLKTIILLGIFYSMCNGNLNKNLMQETIAYIVPDEGYGQSYFVV